MFASAIDDLQVAAKDKDNVIYELQRNLTSKEVTIELLTESFRHERAERKELTETILRFCNIKEGSSPVEVKNDQVEKAWESLKGKRGRNSILTQLEKRAEDLLKTNKIREEKEKQEGKLPEEEPVLTSGIN